MSIPNTFIRPCRKCNEIFKPTSKSNHICPKCTKISLEKRNHKYKEICFNCGAWCRGSLQIEVRVGSIKPFCTQCFEKLREKNPKEIRKILKKQTFK